MHASSGQQQRSSIGSLVPRLQIDEAGQHVSVPEIGGPFSPGASMKQSTQQSSPHIG
jgi:hypothetical protein